MVKTMKVAISLLDEDKIPYKTLCKELFEMQYLSAKAGNRIMTFLYADKQQEFVMKECGIEIPAPKDLYGKSRKTYLYDRVKEVMTASYSANISQTSAFLENQFSTDVKKGLLKGKVSLTNFKNDCAVRLHNKAYTIGQDDKGFIVNISLFNKAKSKELDMSNGRVKFRIPRVSSYERDILCRIMDGEYKQAAGALTYHKKKKKWMLSISFHFTPKECTGQNTLMVKLDRDVLLKLCVKNEASKKAIKMKRTDEIVPGLDELEAMRNKMFALRQSYGNATRIASDNNCGKGYRKRAEKFLALQDKERKYRDTFNHKISRYIVEMAKRYDCGLIMLEDFSKTENVAFQGWPYYDMENKITYKATENGIRVMASVEE